MLDREVTNRSRFSRTLNSPIMLLVRKSRLFRTICLFLTFQCRLSTPPLDLYHLALPLQPAKSHILEQSNWIRVVRRQLLNHIPMLHHTRPIKPPHIHKRKQGSSPGTPSLQWTIPYGLSDKTSKIVTLTPEKLSPAFRISARLALRP